MQRSFLLFCTHTSFTDGASVRIDTGKLLYTRTPPDPLGAAFSLLLLPPRNGTGITGCRQCADLQIYTQNSMHKTGYASHNRGRAGHTRSGCGCGGQPGIRVASRMACISSDTSSGLFWVYVPSVKNGPDKCLVRGACAAGEGEA